MKAITKIISLIVLLSFSYQAKSAPAFLQAWNDRYPNSTSSDRECQLCHQKTTGGNGWNSYGTSIRFLFLSETDIDLILGDLESENSDFDVMGLTNLEEIENGLDPGWVRGMVNSIYFKEGYYLDNQAAPFEDVDGYVADNASGNDALCFPIKTGVGSVVLICL